MLELNKVYCAEAVQFMKKYIPDNFIDLTVTSPPYDNLRDYNGYIFDFKSMAHELYRVTKEGGIIVWVVADETKNFCETLTSFKQAIYFKEQVGFNVLDTMIYKKIGSPSPYPNIRRYGNIFEYMFVLSKGKPKTFNPIKDRENKSYGKINKGNTTRQKDGTTKPAGDYIPKKFGMRYNVWEYHVGKNKDTKDEIALKHPARFPEKLAEDHILTWSNEGDIVFDPMCGSGTTCKMAYLNNRKYIGIEISQDYVNVANERLNNIKYNKINIVFDCQQTKDL
ncbi:MAG TPA: site-specific DNA-methyltransferase [Bacilli bacterium]